MGIVWYVARHIPAVAVAIGIDGCPAVGQSVFKTSEIVGVEDCRPVAQLVALGCSRPVDGGSVAGGGGGEALRCIHADNGVFKCFTADELSIRNRERSVGNSRDGDGVVVCHFVMAAIEGVDAFIRDEDAILGHDGRHGLDFLVGLVESDLHGDDDLAVVGLIESGQCIVESIVGDFLLGLIDSLALYIAEGLGVEAVGDGGMLTAVATGKGLVAKHGDL